MPSDARPPMFAHATPRTPPRVMVMAEIGVNHDGNLGQAVSLVRAAREAGADAVKFQLFHPRRLLSREAMLAAYQDGKADDAYALLEALTFPLKVMRTLRDEARRQGLRFVVTPFSPDDVRDMRSLEVDAVKIASPDAVNGPLLELASAVGVPMLISTGTCALDELTPAALYAARSGGALLQCVSAYPTPEEHAALGGIAALRGLMDRATLESKPHDSAAPASPGINRASRPPACVGYSDHTTAEDTGALAVMAGAVVVEKHLTHNREAAGPDHAASLEPRALARYVRAIRRAELMHGPLAKHCLPVEADVRTVSRQSVCVTADLARGHVLRPQDVTVKRPGIALPASRLGDVIGKTLSRDVRANTLLRAADLVSL